jgi:hypothetical protein
MQAKKTVFVKIQIYSEKEQKAVLLIHVSDGSSDVNQARLAQSAERKTLNLVVVGSSPTLGEEFFFF